MSNNFMEQVEAKLAAKYDDPSMLSYSKLLVHTKMFISGLQGGMMNNEEASNVIAKAVAVWLMKHFENAIGLSKVEALRVTNELLVDAAAVEETASNTPSSSSTNH